MRGKTVFVIGAGASFEANLPVGDDLKDLIVRFLTVNEDNIYGHSYPVDRVILEAFAYGKFQPDSLYDACKKICKAMPQAISIDNYLDAHSNDEFIVHCGKLAIVRSILSAESESFLAKHCGVELTLENLSQTWYSALFKKVSENCNIERIRDRFKSIVLIVFNYDRCIEEYLYRSIPNYYHISQDEAASLIRNIEIYHPYGSVGSLPWLPGQDCEVSDFGLEPNSLNLNKLSEGIKTFSESIQESDSYIQEIRYHIQNASKLVFLGFAFHDQNMKLLFNSSGTQATRKDDFQAYGTTYGISYDDESEIKNYLIERLNISYGQLKMDSVTCSQFFKNYQRGLSFK